MSSPGMVITTQTAAPPETPGLPDHRQLEREVFDELNLARSNPRAYGRYVSDLLAHFDGTLLRRAGAPPVRTVEGASAVREAAAALRDQESVPTLELSSRLSRAPRDLVSDQSRTGRVGHSSSDGATPEMRINRYGRWGLSYSENIAYGPFRNGREVVVNLIVDDGVANRGHRRNIFDPSARIAGVACGSHPKFGMACVIDQTGAFTAR